MKKLIMLFIFCVSCFSLAYANDSAVETAAGGLTLRKERSVLMEKERLFISEQLVRVEYEFRNTTNSPVSSEVAFPIPPYQYVYDDLGTPRDFGDFKAWVDGKAIKVKKEVRAFVNGHEVTEDLRSAGITIENFGNFDPQNDNQIFKLKPANRNKLVKAGALQASGGEGYPPEYWPLWETHLTYYWHQDFPPGKVVRVKHEYRPVSGFSPVQVQKFQDEYRDSCIDAATFDEVKKRVDISMQKEPFGNNYFSAEWVSYILTTANTWQTPIKDFELVIQRDKSDLVTFCWEGAVEKLGNGVFRVHETDFVPTKELKVYFLKNF